MRTEALEVLDTDARIPYVRRRGDYLYNFWRDAANPRGLWRRTTLDSYRSDSPDWDVLIDVDELARADDENWVWAGANVIEPEHTRALVSLSRGGSDAAIVREFDMAHKGIRRRRVRPAGGQVQTQLGRPGHPAGGHRLRRRLADRIRLPADRQAMAPGQPVDDAQTVFEGSPSDVIVAGGVDRTPGFERTFCGGPSTSSTTRCYELRGDELIRIDAPTDATVSVHRQWLLIELRTDWLTGTASYTAGSLLAADYDEFLAGTAQLRVVFEPDEHTSLLHYAWTRDRLVVVTLADVASRVEIVTPGSWQRRAGDRRAGQHQHRHRRRRRYRRRNLLGFQRIRLRRRDYCTGRSTDRWNRSSPRRLSSTPKA